MKRSKPIIVVLLIVAACVGVVVWLARKNKAAAAETEPDDTIDFPIRYGARGEHVKKLQRVVNLFIERNPEAYQVTPLVVDGIWGDKTEQLITAMFELNAINKAQYYEYISLLE